MVTKDCDKGCRGKHSRKFPFFRNPPVVGKLGYEILFFIQFINE